MAKTSPTLFLKQVKQEGRKVTWPVRGEVISASVMVIILVAIASVFFFVVDWVVSVGLQLLLGLS